MPAPRRQRRATAPVLDVEAMRAALAAGRLVRVSIAPSGQFPDGATGRVRAIGDPVVDGDEYLSVEVGAGSAKDVLPFAPTDLLPYSRNGKAAQAPADPAAAATATPRPRRPGRSTPRPRPASPAAAGPATAPPGARGSVGSSRPSNDGGPSGDSAIPSDNPSDIRGDGQGLFDAGPTPAKSSAARRTGRTAGTSAAAAAAAKGRRPPISIVVASDDRGTWTVQARVGARVALKSTPVSPARVSELARQLDEPALIDAVDRLLDDNRRAVQAHADALAAELARVQAELDSYLG